MRFILLLTIIILFSCENRKKTIVNRQQAIKKEMEEVKLFYYNQTDSLDRVKEADTGLAKQHEIAEAFVLIGEQKNIVLIKLHKEYDSLEVALNAER